MRIAIVLSLALCLVAGGPVGKTDEDTTTSKERDISDFHRNFLDELQALQQIRNQCRDNEYLDLQLLQCKECDRFCPDNQCGQCGDYYSAKKFLEEGEAIRLESERRDMREIGIWTALVLLGAGLIGTIVWVACKAEHRHAPLVTTDSEPHDVNKPNPEAQQPDVETFRGLFKANRKVAENDNRNEEEATVPLANVPQPVCQPDQDSNCQELFA